eukprot:15176_1
MASWRHTHDINWIDFIVIICLSLILISITLPMSYKAIVLQIEQKLPKSVYISQIIFDLSTISLAIAYIFLPLQQYPSAEWRATRSIIQFAYIVNTMTVINILYHRLVNIFNGSPLEISNGTKNAFICLCIVCIVTGISMFFIQTMFRANWTVTYITAVVALLCVVIVIMFLTGMFVYKLRLVLDSSHGSADGDDEIKPIISRFTVLSCIGMTGTLIYIICNSIYSLLPHHDLYLVLHVGAYMDVLSNVICLSLSYPFTKEYYNKFCFACDRGCQKCWMKETNDSVHAAASMSSIASISMDNTVTIN